MIGWIKKLFTRDAPVAVAPPPPTFEYMIGDDGQLVPVYSNYPDERLMSRDEAEDWLDANAYGWRRFGEPPAYVIDGEPLYAESDLVRWLQDG